MNKQSKAMLAEIEAMKDKLDKDFHSRSPTVEPFYPKYRRKEVQAMRDEMREQYKKHSEVEQLTKELKDTEAALDRLNSTMQSAIMRGYFFYVLIAVALVSFLFGAI